MNFKINFDIQPPESKLNIKHKLMLLGSCFASTIGEKLVEHKFKTLINPNGILFNPINVFSSLQSYILGKTFTEKDLFLNEELWYSWQHHGLFADMDKKVALKNINHSQEQAISYIKNVDTLILTFGSAFVYEHSETKEIVANCHKVAQKHFKKRLLTVTEIVQAFNQCGIVNLDSKIILTVSPVKYLRDGLIENTLSKSILIQSIYEIIQQHKNVYYFPSYEIVTDELRDYRFYENDMVHPNALAINYVWERFGNTLFDEETMKLLKEIKDILSAKQHKPFNPKTIKHQFFLKTYLEKAKTLSNNFPFLDLKEEINYFGNSD